MKPLALRVQVRGFETVCRAAQAGLGWAGLGADILPLAAARGFAQDLELKILPLSDDWALRHVQLCTRGQPPRQTPLGILCAHLEACAEAEIAQ